MEGILRDFMNQDRTPVGSRTLVARPVSRPSADVLNVRIKAGALVVTKTFTVDRFLREFPTAYRQDEEVAEQPAGATPDAGAQLEGGRCDVLDNHPKTALAIGIVHLEN